MCLAMFQCFLRSRFRIEETCGSINVYNVSLLTATLASSALNSSTFRCFKMCPMVNAMDDKKKTCRIVYWSTFGWQNMVQFYTSTYNLKWNTLYTYIHILVCVYIYTYIYIYI